MHYIETNIGKIPLEDYYEIQAIQFGFNSYYDLLSSGYTININQNEIINIEE